MNIYMAGLIGAGKTTVGKQLAERLGWADMTYRTDRGKSVPEEVDELIAILGEGGWVRPD